MENKNLFAMIFILASILNGLKGEDCETYYDGNGLCVEPCPDDMITYISDCVTPTMSQRTCRQSEAQPLEVICDYIRCDCESPKVYDEVAKKCVHLQNCSDQSSVKSALIK